MKTTLTAETIADAIAISWGSAHAAETHHDWLFRWQGVTDQIAMTISLTIYASDANNRAEAEALREDLRLLWNVAFENCYSPFGRQPDRSESAQQPLFA